MHDIMSNVRLQQHVAAASLAVGATNGTTVDLQGFTNVGFLISCGTVGVNGTIDAKLQYSDDGVTFYDATQADTGVATVAIAQKNAPFQDRLYVARSQHRYWRTAVTIGTAASVVSVTAALGGARHLPVALS